MCYQLLAVTVKKKKKDYYFLLLTVNIIGSLTLDAVSEVELTCPSPQLSDGAGEAISIGQTPTETSPPLCGLMPQGPILKSTRRVACGGRAGKVSSSSPPPLPPLTASRPVSLCAVHHLGAMEEEDRVPIQLTLVSDSTHFPPVCKRRGRGGETDRETACPCSD